MSAMGVKALAHDLKGHMAKTELEENNQCNVSFFYEKKMIKLRVKLKIKTLQEYERDKEGKEFGQQEKIHFHTPVSQG